MKVLITGGQGQLGQALFRALSPANYIYAPERRVMDVTKIQDIDRVVPEVGPDIIIHSAAVTDVDRCELNPGRAFQVNSAGTYNMARAAQVYGAVFLYISTNFVFHGSQVKPYREEAKPSPVNIYGWSKLLGEALVSASLNRYFIVRTSWLYGGKSNFVSKILTMTQQGQKIFAAGDQLAAPTFVDDLARAISLLIGSDQYGIYHLINRGFCSRFEWVKQILLYSDLEAELEQVDSTYFSNPARRPNFAALDNQRFKYNYGLELRDWQEGLYFYLKHSV